MLRKAKREDGGSPTRNAVPFARGQRRPHRASERRNRATEDGQGTESRVLAPGAADAEDPPGHAGQVSRGITLAGTLLIVGLTVLAFAGGRLFGRVEQTEPEANWNW